MPQLEFFEPNPEMVDCSINVSNLVRSVSTLPLPFSAILHLKRQ